MNWNFKKAFQSLIGRLKTKMIDLYLRNENGVSIPYR